MNRTATITMLTNTAATHHRVGNTNMAARFEAKATRYSGMTDAEFDTEKAASHNPARDAAARQMTTDLFRKTR